MPGLGGAGEVKRFQAKHALGLEPGVETGSRQENAPKINGTRKRRDNLTQLAARIRITI
jgi:hypothetical protein